VLASKSKGNGKGFHPSWRRPHHSNSEGTPPSRFLIKPIENLYIFNYKLCVWLINLKRVKNGVWV
jgi:hypothetical protein